MTTIADVALNILNATNVDDKTKLTHHGFTERLNGNLSFQFNQTAPKRPGRPEKPELLSPKEMPKRRGASGNTARIAMLHAIAHIELNAIDLAWDIILRFGKSMPIEFTNDWIKVADDEARHFELLNNRLMDLDSYYGALPAHDGLWQSAEKTSHDLKAKLAVVPLVLEARGLDVTPSLIQKFRSSNDKKSVAALEIIYREEVDHVKAGNNWFNYVCNLENLNPQTTYHSLVKKYFARHLKSPFNKEARDKASLAESFYLPLSAN
ncbi:ferritin-like domain-containing protein [Emcibacteraceae bacterium]|nr:ferritin-like domain-containing protein [Emcibacteraceae bacterium]